MKRIMTLILLFLLVIPFFPEAQASTQNEGTNVDEWVELGVFRDTTYYRTYARWQKEYKVIDMDEELEFEFSKDSTLTTNQLVNYVDEKDISYAQIENGKSVDIIVNVSQTGLYELGFSYMTTTDFTSLPYVGIKIDGQEQYNEISNIALEVSWYLKQRAEEDRYNRYGNELLPYSVANNTWFKHYLDDTNSRYNKPYKVLLQKGDNTITVTNLSSTLKLSKLYLNNTKDNISYEDYIKAYSNAQIIIDRETINAENISEKNLLKLYLNDVGILTGILYGNNIRAVLDDERSINLGSVYETVVASELIAHGHKLFYYDNRIICGWRSFQS